MFKIMTIAIALWSVVLVSVKIRPNPQEKLKEDKIYVLIEGTWEMLEVPKDINQIVTELTKGVEK